MESIDGVDGLVLDAAVMPYLQEGAAQALRAVVGAEREPVHVYSAYRTLPQQYLLYRWYLEGRCGIYLAARPGRSNHESGLAIDIGSAQRWRPVLARVGFRWLGHSDPVHFDFAYGGRDLRSISVRAFQRLWNRNHPEDRIGEDGDFGPATESRLSRAPAAGFAFGASCGDPALPMAEPTPAPERVAEDERGCLHVNGGRYSDRGCSTAYQCCGGAWETRGACGACSCTDPWGTSGCESSATDEREGDASEGDTESAEPREACSHTGGGRYRHSGCSASFQCCDGRWESRGACGACACTEPWGREGC